MFCHCLGCLLCLLANSWYDLTKIRKRRSQSPSFPLKIGSQINGFFEVPDRVTPPKPIAKEREREGQQKVSPAAMVSEGGEEADEKAAEGGEVIGVGGYVDKGTGP